MILIRSPISKYTAHAVYGTHAFDDALCAPLHLLLHRELILSRALTDKDDR